MKAAHAFLLCCAPLLPTVAGAQQAASAGLPRKGAATAPVPAAAPVQWRLGPAPRIPVRAGQEFTVDVQARVAPGWHLYALDEPEGGPLPLEFELEPGSSATLVTVGADRPEHGPAAGTEAASTFYLGEPRFKLHLRSTPAQNATGSQIVVVVLRFQACNDHLCLPPHTARLRFPMPPGRATGTTP